MMRDELNRVLGLLCKTMPESYALVYGSEAYPDIQGTVLFYPLWGGTLVVAEISGLPSLKEKCKGQFFGFHIQEVNVMEQRKIRLQIPGIIIIPTSVSILTMREICRRFWETTATL
mgnify:CR=1 FL=1